MLAVVAGLAIAALITSADAATTARQSVEIHASGSTETADWRLANRALLVSAAGHTQLIVRLTRTSAVAQSPALTADFDGSGGGDARLIECKTGSTRWSAALHASQTVSLRCDQYVTPFAVRQLEYVYAAAQ